MISSRVIVEYRLSRRCSRRDLAGLVLELPRRVGKDRSVLVALCPREHVFCKFWHGFPNRTSHNRKHANNFARASKLRETLSRGRSPRLATDAAKGCAFADRGDGKSQSALIIGLYKRAADGPSAERRGKSSGWDTRCKPLNRLALIHADDQS